LESPSTQKHGIANETMVKSQSIGLAVFYQPSPPHFIASLILITTTVILSNGAIAGAGWLINGTLLI
jgi:hypothetical protein